MYAAISPRRIAPATAITTALAAGAAVGVATSFGQGRLDGVLNAFVNSSAAWLVAPFAIGAAVRAGGRWSAAGLGLLTCVVQVVAYYVTAELRGFPGTQHEIVFWTVCALAGGPVFGAAGRCWRIEAKQVVGLGGATLGAAFLAEGLWTYAHRLDRPGTAATWCAIGVAALLSEGRTRLTPAAWWLTATLPLALLAEVGLTLIRR